MLFSAAAVLIQQEVGAFRTDLTTTADEAAHFVNSLMIHDYVFHAFGQNPITFATQYYGHFPRVSIGHWPPFFHLTQALLVATFSRSAQAAILYQAVIAGALAATTCGIVARRHGTILGAAAAVTVLLSPTILFALHTVMLDNFLALLVLLAALSWARFCTTISWKWAAIFALLTSAAILTKGYAYGLALLPLFYALLSGGLPPLLRSRKLYVVALVIAASTIPWYALTFRFLADGFIYSWGLGFTALAAGRYAILALTTFGAVTIAAFSTTVAARNRSPRADTTSIAMISVAASIIFFQLIVPADIQPRYLTPLVAPVVIVAVDGLTASWQALAKRAQWQTSPLLGTIYACALLAVSVGLTFRLQDVATLQTDQAARDIMAAPDKSPFILVAGGDHTEGGLIAAFASLDPGQTHYVVRGTKALSDSNFLGTDYHSRFATDTAVEKWIVDSHIGWIAMDTSPDSLRLFHDRQVMNLVTGSANGWDTFARYRNPGGDLIVYRLNAKHPDKQDIARVLAQVGASNIIGQGASTSW